MRTLPRISIVRTLLTLAVLVAAMAAIHHATAHIADGTLAAAAPLMLGPLRGFGKTYDLLKSLMKPAQADQPESIPWVLYDSQPYAAAGVSSLTFFANATAANAADPTLSNFASGALEGGYYFEVHRVHVMIDTMPTSFATSAVTGAAGDVETMHKSARGILTFSMKGKTYGPTKLAYFGRPGGPLPSFSIAAASAVVVATGQTENNGGFPYLGNIIIPPVTNFKGVMQFNTTAINALTLVTVGLMGILHRPVS